MVKLEGNILAHTRNRFDTLAFFSQYFSARLLTRILALLATALVAFIVAGLMGIDYSGDTGSARAIAVLGTGISLCGIGAVLVLDKAKLNHLVYPTSTMFMAVIGLVCKMCLR